MCAVSYSPFKPADLWEIISAVANPSPNMHLGFSQKVGNEFTGFGIYAVSYRHENAKEYVIYLGKFAGKKTKDRLIDDALAGDVRDRWFKHIGTATLLLSGLRMNSHAGFKQHISAMNSFFSNDKAFHQCVELSLLGLTENQLNTHVFIKNGNQISANRLGFAIQNLTTTNPTNIRDIEVLKTVVSRFTCHYWRVKSSQSVTKTQIEPFMSGTKDAPGVEKRVINAYRTQLPMNAEFTPDKRLDRTHYHYNPESLIEVGSSAFLKLSNFIIDELKKSFSLNYD